MNGEGLAMLELRRLAIILGTGFAIATAFYSAPAAAQATRTWVSGVGDDANPCSRTAPCKTFAGAISKTAAGGEINCLDPAGYGAVTITKSITIDCEDTQGSILASSTTGVIVNAAGVNVTLRGLSFNGAGTTPGLHGVRFLQGSSLVIEDCIIQNFTSTSAGAGNGVLFAPSTAASLEINRCTIVRNGSATTGGGVVIAPTGAGGSARVTLNEVRAINNGRFGVRLDAGGSTSATGSRVAIFNSEMSGSPTGVSIRTAAGASSAEGMLVDSTMVGNSVGVEADGSTAVLRVGNSTITANAVAVNSANAGQIRSYGDNRADGNTAASSFTPPVLAKQ